MRIDLHTHSNVSDGTDAPAALVARAAAVRLDALALTDHDTFDGLDEAVAAGERAGVQVVRGVELSCSQDGHSVHLLGYGADETAEPLATEMARIRQGRSGRLGPVLAKLAELGLPLTEAEVLAQVGSSPSVGRPHIADAMVAAGYVRDRTQAFDRYLAEGGPAHVPRYTLSVADGIGLVHQAGGVAVIAHPWGRGREHALPTEVLEGFAVEQGLDGVEVDHQDHDPPTRARLRALAGRLGLLATGSSDYHGSGKPDHNLGCNLTPAEVFTEIIRRTSLPGPREIPDRL